MILIEEEIKGKRLHWKAKKGLVFIGGIDEIDFSFYDKESAF